MTSLVSKNEVALLFTLVGVFDSIGQLAGAPLLALSFKYGIKKGGLLFGLPFYCAAGIYIVSGISIWVLKPPEKTRYEEGNGEQENMPSNDEES